MCVAKKACVSLLETCACPPKYRESLLSIPPSEKSNSSRIACNGKLYCDGGPNGPLPDKPINKPLSRRIFVSARYLLPCRCGKRIPVEPRQAGESIQCSCGVLLKVPTLRAIRALEMEELGPELVATQESAPTWGVLQGMALLGAAITLAALAIAGWLIATLPTPPPAPPDPQQIRDETEALVPFQVLRVWHSIKNTRLVAGRTPSELAYRDRLFRHRLGLGVVGAIGMLGIVLCVATTFSARSRNWKARPPSSH